MAKTKILGNETECGYTPLFGDSSFFLVTGQHANTLNMISFLFFSFRADANKPGETPLSEGFTFVASELRTAEGRLYLVVRGEGAVSGARRGEQKCCREL